MKIAVLSDIHGNLTALEAVLADAYASHADGFLYVGDYCLGSPNPNECLSLMRDTGGWTVRGNEEDYIERLIGQDQTTWTDGQMQISYWNFRHISPENRNYMLSMPKKRTLAIGDLHIHVTHSSESVIGQGEHAEWHTSRLALRYQNEHVVPERLARDIKASLTASATFQRAFEQLADGVYVFGHTHVQWDYASQDGRKLMINPGSCGLPLDCIEGGAPYTLLHIDEKPYAERRRVPFDIDAHISRIKRSSQYDEARVWSELIIEEIRTRREKVFFFLAFMKQYAERIGDPVRPYSLSTWESGYERWKEQH